MVGPIPFVSGGISQVAGLIISSSNNQNINYKYVSTTSKCGTLKKIFLYMNGLREFVTAVIFNRPDIIHLHVSKGGSILRKSLLETISIIFHIPTILHLHNYLPQLEGTGISSTYGVTLTGWILKQIFRWMLTQAAGNISLSPLYTKSIRPLTSNLKFYEIYNPVNCQLFKPKSQDSKYPVVLFIGDFTKRKGAIDLLKSIPIVKKNYPNVRYIFCGVDANKEFYNTALSDGLLEYIELPGFVSNQKKIDLFMGATIFALPSYEEGVPMAILEAMAAGLPTVTTPVGGIPDILTNNENTIFVNPGNIVELSKAIIQLLDNKQFRMKMGKNNQTKAKQMFDVPVYLNMLNEVYFKTFT